jgi:predicted hydrolase (HD superfamily)
MTGLGDHNRLFYLSTYNPESLMQRQQALQLLHQYTQTTSLRGHAYCVEAAMRAYARLWQENEEVYGICGLLHDFDYERWPQEHPQRGQSILREAGLSDAICEAIMGHADHTGVARTSRMAKTLFAVDELCGFIVAVALVKPDKSISSVQVKSVKKKLKDKRFAAKIDRQAIRFGAEEIGVELDKHIAIVLSALVPIATAIGLQS